MEKILFEIGTEELPANYMPNIIKELQALALKNWRMPEFLIRK